MDHEREIARSEATGAALLWLLVERCRTSDERSVEPAEIAGVLTGGAPLGWTSRLVRARLTKLVKAGFLECDPEVPSAHRIKNMGAVREALADTSMHGVDALGVLPTALPHLRHRLPITPCWRLESSSRMMCLYAKST